MRGIDFEDELQALILSKREDDYWDFKQQHHSNKANLLHDIICMANNRADRNAYIIFGIADGTFDVVGVENDENRRNQQQMIDFLKTKKFVSGIRPRVELRTLLLTGHEVDVLIIMNSTDTPYFLTEDFPDNGRKVHANHIYTRVGDTNTDIDKSADINNIEYLWKKRFLLTRSPFEQIMKHLENKEEWKQDDDTYYNIYNPEFTIAIEFDEDDRRFLIPEFYAYAMYNESTMYQMLSIKYFGTQLYGKQIALLDSGRYSTPTPDRGYLYFGEHRMNADYGFRFFTKDSPAGEEGRRLEIVRDSDPDPRIQKKR
ncbi:ATP-binding protein [Paenibacillus polymyxa]|uniref:ATP-binding protein n=1 Tax=Paenibacillus polymyxa TaxID=1406 RepID=UPI0025B6D180|nr:ATP-binding protein [Paenibacillus polymyxa]MDN4079365.1 ATP-binding protein [Paenibacillus polymyxa]MDN4104786.1 ATP-binding protein [Paenibacillus polymyxa]MDN4115177.1 ATP-binding protein [Paenibacillus polymyxa]